MKNVHGLATKTCSGRVRIVQRLLQGQFAGRSVVISAIRLADVRQFIAEITTWQSLCSRLKEVHTRHDKLISA
jgi:hypothetical protein